MLEYAHVLALLIFIVLAFFRRADPDETVVEMIDDHRLCLEFVNNASGGIWLAKTTGSILLATSPELRVCVLAAAAQINSGAIRNG